MIEVIYYCHDIEGIFESDELSRVSLYLLAVLKLARSAVDGVLREEMNTPEWLLVDEAIVEFLDIDPEQLTDMRDAVIEKLAQEE